MTRREREQALFEPDAGRWRPTPLSRGPWSPDALHGGPVAALVARAAEHAGDPATGPGGPVLVRLTLELLRPVPFDPLAVEARVVRPGRKVQLVDVTVRAGDTEVAWARALRIRRLPEAEAAVGAEARPGGTDGQAAIPGPDADHVGPQVDGDPAFHNGGAELRFVAGSWDRLGPSTVWTRLAVPVVPGEEPTGAQRAVAAADFGNGVSAVVPFDRWRFVNPDLTVVLERPPEGEWVALQAATELGAAGIGVARSVLWDRRGPTGTGTQTLVVEPR